MSIPWHWDKGTIEARNPPETLDVQLLSQLQGRSNWVAVTSRETETSTMSLVESPQSSQGDTTSEAGAAFGGPVPGGYTAAFHQNWEMSVPSFWSNFTHDTVFITIDVVVSFSNLAHQPDPRNAGSWVWEIDVSNLLTAVSPTYTNFRHIESGIYRCVIKAVGYLLGGNHKIRFGFNFKSIWEAGPQTTSWMSTIEAAAHLISSTITGRQLGISAESMPSNATLVPEDEDLDLDLLFSEAADNGSDSPTEWAML